MLHKWHGKCVALTKSTNCRDTSNKTLEFLFRSQLSERKFIKCSRTTIIHRILTFYLFCKFCGELEPRPHRFLCTMIKAYLFSALEPANRFTNASSSPGFEHKSTSCLGLFGDKAIFHRTADVRFLRITHMMAVYSTATVYIIIVRQCETSVTFFIQRNRWMLGFL